MFVEVALAGQADVIVTGNVKHFVPRRGSLGVHMQLPREFVNAMRREHNGGDTLTRRRLMSWRHTSADLGLESFTRRRELLGRAGAEVDHHDRAVRCPSCIDILLYNHPLPVR